MTHLDCPTNVSPYFSSLKNFSSERVSSRRVRKPRLNPLLPAIGWWQSRFSAVASRVARRARIIRSRQRIRVGSPSARATTSRTHCRITFFRFQIQPSTTFFQFHAVHTLRKCLFKLSLFLDLSLYAFHLHNRWLPILGLRSRARQ